MLISHLVICKQVSSVESSPRHFSAWCFKYVFAFSKKWSSINNVIRDSFLVCLAFKSSNFWWKTSFKTQFSSVRTMTELVDESVLRKFTCLFFLHLVLFLRTPPKKPSPCFFYPHPKNQGWHNYMTPGRLSRHGEFTPVPSHGSTFVYMTPPQKVMPARVAPVWVHSSCRTGARISLRYEISQRYHVNTKRPPVSVWNQSARRLERVAHA